MRAYQVTRDPRAIDLARRLVKVNIQCFDDDGRILETAGPHFHSIADTVQGIIAYAQVTTDANLLAHTERIYRHGLRPRGLHATGWFPEHVHPDGCCSPSLRTGGEICCTANMISSALLLGRAGFAYAFEDAERYIRNMLFASQLLDLSSVDISDSDEPRWAEFRQRLLGNVAGFPASNSAYDPSSPHLTQLCCAAQAAEALVDARDATATSTPDALCVNLLFSIDHTDAIVQSSLPAHGSIKITPRREAIVKIKAPTWSPPDAYVLRKAKKRMNSVATMDRHGYLDVGPCRANESIELRLQLPKYKTVEGCALQPDVTFHWRGNSIIACNPQPPLLPFYSDRKHLRAPRKRTTPTMAS
jgi:hypothetical protein